MELIKRISVLTFCLILCLHTVGGQILTVDATTIDSNEYYMSVDDSGNVSYIAYENLSSIDNDEVMSLDLLEYSVIKNIGEDVEVIEENLNIEQAKNLYSGLSTIPMQIIDEETVTFSYELSTTSSDITSGVVVFLISGVNSSTTVDYINANTGVAGYMHPQSAPDAAFLGIENGKVKFLLSGVTGLVDSSLVSVLSYDDFIQQGYTSTYYKISSGKIRHYLTSDLKSFSSITFGYQPDYMNTSDTYYSYDGHYFYTNYKTMLDDYYNGVRTNSVNSSSPYYNYFQYLPHRTTSSYTVSALSTYINSKSKVTIDSSMYNFGSAFIEAQSLYSVNALLMMGVAANESGWGTSDIATSKNNLFGHGAVDSNPYYGANGYDSAADSVLFHAEYFVSQWYSNYTDYRYFGSHLGNKESGMNVKYASDPYWGEKAAATVFVADEGNDKKDYNQETIAIANGNVYIYQEASNSTLIASTGNGKGTSYTSKSDTLEVPMIVIGYVEGQSINGNNVWYKIQTDTSLNSSRTAVSGTNVYDYSRDYGYVHSDELEIIIGTASDLGDDTQNENTPDEESPESNSLIADVNNDGVITAVDYMMIKNHIMGYSTLTGTSLLTADVNNDGVITAVDYMMIKNHIMGYSSLY